MKAYPYMHKHPTSGQTTMSDGMDLRDWFAGMALQGFLFADNHITYGAAVMESYKVADAMIKQREVKDVPNE